MSELGYDSDSIIDIQRKLNSQSTVILSASSKLVKNGSPSGWMIIHAMFDDSKSWDAPWAGFVEELQHSILDAEFDTMLWNKILTMRSARNGLLRTPGDIVAEMLTQEIVTTSGLKVNVLGDEIENAAEINAFVNSIVSQVKQADIRGLLVQTLAGRLVWVSSSIL